MAESPHDVETIGYEQFMSIMHEDPRSLPDLPDFSQLKAATWDSDHEDPPTIVMPSFCDDSSNFELINEADSGEVHGLLGTGQPGGCERLHISASDCWNSNACKTLQADQLCETPPSSSSDLCQHFEFGQDLDPLVSELAVDSERPQQRDGSVLASDWTASRTSENDRVSHVPPGNLMDSARSREMFHSIVGSPYLQNAKSNSGIANSGWGHQCSTMRELVDLTQTDSSEDEMEIGSTEFEKFTSNDLKSDVHRKLPQWGKPSKKNIRTNGFMGISQSNSTFTEASDWNLRKMPINAHERRIVGLQFQGASGTVLTPVETATEKGTAGSGNIHQNGVFNYDKKHHIKDERRDGSIYSYQKSGFGSSDGENQKFPLKDIPYYNDESDTDDVPDYRTERRYLPNTLCSGRSISTGSGLHIPPRNYAGLWTKGEDGKQICRPRSDDERLTYRAVLQDLAQPKQEVSIDADLLAVPLLRHQRIALAWMVQKETNSMQCAGGILADDQGLGKTISTIALILKERPPAYKSSLDDSKKIKSEPSAVNLDEDDVEVTDFLGETSDRKMHDFARDENYCMKESVSSVKRGRPSAGTLVVCPTSVLRQWAQEIRDKVTTKADLSLLVYHGSNRTKDPDDLAKYDVVLTTYSIVSMEVPKQELTDENDEDERNPDDYGLCEFSSCMKKKKKLAETIKKGSKGRKRTNDLSSEHSPRPLARVSWFRVVLDEAQSIKNHRTQVARACWSLRAKRRWCLSGTPIQNAIDDLYSYFRFLKYDPYAVYKSFCSRLKMPITRDPMSGYKKLQAVLKTIMLRRTKGTVLDGDPIVNLPPKTIKLRKVDFSLEERAFYSRLEADSRAQFKVYAAAGTVKQNYVNILLMLLRLRQACDHPLLVKSCSSDSTWRSSAEAARKLPREQQIDLMNRLEGSLAICSICNDAPEEAVVTVCGHIFCNQCILEHITQADDTHCPFPQCKCLLKLTSIFSLVTLKNCTSDKHGHDEASESLLQVTEPESYLRQNMGLYSSKIRAALEVLQSLPKLSTSISKSTDSDVERDSCSSDRQANGILEDGTSDRFHQMNPGLQPSLKKQILETSEKAIVFSQWTSMLDLLESPLRNSCIQYRRLDGTMSVLARDRAVNDFKTLPEVTVMIMSLKAASLGLNMVAACHVLLLDLWWNPTTEDQAIDRAHRIGQTRPVSVSRFTVKDTVEDRILALQDRKREMVASAFGEDEAGGQQTRLTEDDLRYLFMV